MGKLKYFDEAVDVMMEYYTVMVGSCVMWSACEGVWKAPLWRTSVDRAVVRSVSRQFPTVCLAAVVPAAAFTFLILSERHRTRQEIQNIYFPNGFPPPPHKHHDAAGSN